MITIPMHHPLHECQQDNGPANVPITNRAFVNTHTGHFNGRNSFQRGQLGNNNFNPLT